jgi:predicted FMN-binding regulatory protein PaiB
MTGSTAGATQGPPYAYFPTWSYNLVNVYAEVAPADDGNAATMRRRRRCSSP